MPTPEQMAETMKANLKEKTGKTLTQWLAVARKSGHDKHGVLVKHLKTDHGMTHGFANLIAHEHLRSAAGHQDGEDLVAGQYAGKKAGLKPIYDALQAIVAKLGKDIELAPKKAYVSLRRSKQFGLIQPSTQTRVDLGLNLNGADPTKRGGNGRLEAAGTWNSMCSHRVRLTSAADVDAEVAAWLALAYDSA